MTLTARDTAPGEPGAVSGAPGRREPADCAASGWRGEGLGARLHRCGKRLNTFQRSGQDWYCGVCGPTPTRCVGCGNIGKITSRDRQGRPRCHGRPPDDAGDPIQILLQVITAVDPDLAAATATDAVLAVTARAGERRRLAWAMQDHPELLTGAGARAPVPSVLRLIDALIGAGAKGVVRPP